MSVAKRASSGRRSLRIALEGNIATGKSTFLDYLNDHFGDEMHTIQEPVSKWTAVENESDDNITSSQRSGGNLLDLFYKDSKRWAYTFQSYAFLSRMKAQLAKQDNVEALASKRFTVFERSVYSDRVCFAHNCHDAGLISDMEYNIYCDFHTFLIESLDDLQLDAIIYLRSSPETCMSRLKMRARSEEAGVPMDYLQALGTRHDDWLKERSSSCPGLDIANIPIHIVDCNVDFKHDESARNTLMQEAYDFMNSLESTERK